MSTRGRCLLSKGQVTDVSGKKLYQWNGSGQPTLAALCPSLCSQRKTNQIWATVRGCPHNSHPDCGDSPCAISPSALPEYFKPGKARVSRLCTPVGLTVLGVSRWTRKGVRTGRCKGRARLHHIHWGQSRRFLGHLVAGVTIVTLLSMPSDF